jgi:hypothetical protein
MTAAWMKRGGLVAAFVGISAASACSGDDVAPPGGAGAGGMATGGAGAGGAGGAAGMGGSSGGPAAQLPAQNELDTAAGRMTSASYSLVFQLGRSVSQRPATAGDTELVSAAPTQ